MYRMILILGALVMLIFIAPLSGADPSDNAEQPSPAMVTPHPFPRLPLTTDKLLQRDVTNNVGVKIAKLDELVIDDAGDIRYAILSYGGLLTVGEKHILVPWRVLRLSSDPTAITLDITADELKFAPRIDREEWRNLTGINWRDVDRYYINLFASHRDNASSLADEFRLLDRNRDRFISKKEATQIPILIKAFNRADTNHDSRLDQGEFANFKVTDGVSSSSQPGTVTKQQAPANR